MNTNMLTPTVAATILTSTVTPAGNRIQSTEPTRMVVIKVGDSPMRRAHTYWEEIAHVAQFIMGQTDSRECVPGLTTCENVM
jgi:hypothetical protein